MIAKIAFGLKYPGLIPLTHYLTRSEWFSYDQLKRRQEQDLSRLVAFAYQNVPYYRRIFDARGLAPADIKTARDLGRLPVLTKKIIRENPADFAPANLGRMRYVARSSSGSTGMPFQYRLSRRDLEYSIAFLFRSRGIGGYRLGDRLALLSVRSQPMKLPLLRKLRRFVLNQRSYACFQIGREQALRNIEDLNRFKPEYILGSPLTLSVFAKFIVDNGLRLNFRLKALYANGEKLFDNQRALIEDTLQAPLFDLYGLDDGGISANECERHDGMHIDMERGILEVVDGNGLQVMNEKGRILATSLHNYAMPFIRYETGDLGVITDRLCTCGRKTPLLQEISGRIESFLTAPSGVRIHGTLFAESLAKLENIHQFQVVQNRLDEVMIRVVPIHPRNADKINIDALRSKIAETDRNLKLTLEIISEDGLEYTQAGKYKFVINNLQST